MTRADGSLKFDTKIDDGGFSDGMSKIGSIASTAMAAATTSMVGMSAYAIKAGSDFQAGMSEVAAISNASAEDVQKLTDKAKEMGIQTKFSATEASEAMKYMAMAGWDASEMVDGVGGIMNLAAASGEDLANVSDIVTDALTAFGLQAKDSAHFADVLAKAASSSNTNVGMMGGTFQYVAPVAGALGYSVEDTAVAIGLMANSGIKAEKAGTALRGMLTRMIKPTDEVEGVMDKLGITITNSDGSVKPFAQTMKELRAAFADLTDEQKAQYAASLAGQEAMSGFLAIVNASDTDFEKLSSAINNADGTAQKMADTMNDNLKGSVTLLGSSLEGLGIAAFDHFEKPMREAVDGATKKVNDLSKSMSSGKLGKLMSKVADGFGAIVETVLNLATDALPVLVDGFAFVVDHGKKIIPILTGIGTALIGIKIDKFVSPLVDKFKSAYKAVKDFAYAQQAAVAFGLEYNDTLTLGQAMLGLLSGKLDLATAKQAALNAVQSMSPHVWLIAGIAGITAGLTALAFALSDSDSETKKLWDDLKETQQTWEDLQAAQEEELSASLSQINNVQRLRNELKYLVDENGKVKEGYQARAEFILGELNTALGTEYSMTGNMIDNYKELSNSVDNLIQKKRNQAILDAQEPLYQEAINKQMEEAIELEKLKNEISEKQNEQQKIENELIKQYGENWQQKAQDANDARAQDYHNLEASISQKQGLLAGYQESYDKHTSTIIAYENNMTLAASNNSKDWAKIQTGNIEITATTYAEKRKLLEEELGGAKYQYEHLKELYEQGEAGVTEAMVAEAEERVKVKQSELDGMESIVVEFAPEIAARYEEAAYESLEKYMSQSEKYFGVSQKEMSNLIAGLKSKDPEVRKKAEETATSMMEKLSSKNDQYSKVGAQVIQGIISGLEIKTKGLFAQASYLSLGLLNTFKETLNICSPSKAFKKAAEFVPDGAALGILKNTPKALKAVKQMGAGMLDEFMAYTDPMQQALEFNDGLRHMRNVAVNRMQGFGSHTCLNNSVYSQNSQNPIKIEIIDRSQNKQSLVLENGAEVAHWLAPHLNRELGLGKG